MIALVREAAAAILREAVVSSDGNETGGILLGHDLDGGLRVTTAGAPGPSAVRTPTRFLRDLAYSQGLADEAYDRDYSVWLGEWHTHPTGPAEPSPLDLRTYSSHLASADLAFERFLALIIVPCTTHGWAEVNIVPWLVTSKAAVVVPFTIEPEPEHV